jgi:hypothetical protein
MPFLLERRLQGPAALKKPCAVTRAAAAKPIRVLVVPAPPPPRK